MNSMLAIDGGGTSCRAAIAGPDGAILGRAEAGPANISTDPDGAIRNIIAAAESALSEAGRADEPLSSFPAFLGLAGANLDFDEQRFTTRLPFSQCRIEDDAGIALQGALGDSDGAVAVLGTGSVYFGRRHETISRAGGWGFAVGDLGSGARIGRAVFEETLLAYDNVRPETPLTRRLLQDFSDDPAELAEFAQKAKPAGFARFAPQVFEFAGRGDEVGRAIVDRAVNQVDAALDAFLWPDCASLCLLGGLAPLYSKRIAHRFRAILRAPKADALTGAVQLGMRAFALQADHG